MTNEELWRAALGELELLISKANFTTWFKETTVVSLIDDKVVVGVPNAFTKVWLENKYNIFIIKALQNITGLPIKIITYQVNLGSKIINFTTKQTMAEPTLISNSNKPETPAPAFGLNANYTFDTLVVGKHNELARAAAQAVAQNPGQSYNPLFIYGASGLGKTHLLQAIAYEIYKKYPEKKIMYVPCEKFTSEFIQGIQTGRMDKFKALYRSVDILMIDDIQFLAGKEGTQEEFFHTFNALYQANKQIVISSDRPPKAIQTLENRLITRFECGMIADIVSPDVETRTAILEYKCRERNYQLDHEIIQYLATNIQNNIRELEGALNRLIAIHQLQNKAPTLESARELIATLHPNTTGAGLTPKKIISIVAAYYGAPVDELFGASRKKHLVTPRQIAMYLMREELKSSFPTIGQEFGGRDHTTAMHACLKISQAVENDGKTQQDIHNIRQQLCAN